MSLEPLQLSPSRAHLVTSLPGELPPISEEGSLQGRAVSTVEKGISWEKVAKAALTIILVAALLVGGCALLAQGAIAGGVITLLAAFAIGYLAAEKASQNIIGKLTSFTALEVPVATLNIKGEDRHLAVRYRGEGGSFDLIGVFDGHGGKGEVAEFVKENLPGVFQHYLNDTGDPAVAFRKAFKELDEGAKKLIQDNQLKDGAGTTAVVSFINRQTREVYTATLGDSEARVLSANEERLAHLSEVLDWASVREHARIGATPARGRAGFFVADGEIQINPPGKQSKKVNLSVFTGRYGEYDESNCSRGIGHRGILAGLISHVPLVRHSIMGGGEQLLLGSDGLWDNLQTLDNVEKYLDHMQSRPPEEGIEAASVRFVREDYERAEAAKSGSTCNRKDDVTVMRYQFE